MLPTITREFDASKTAIAWVVVAFALGLAGSGLAAGKLGDLIGFKRMAVTSFVFEFVLLIGIVAVPALWMLFPLRFLQGVARAGSTKRQRGLADRFFPNRKTRQGPWCALLIGLRRAASGGRLRRPCNRIVGLERRDNRSNGADQRSHATRRTLREGRPWWPRPHPEHPKAL